MKQPCHPASRIVQILLLMGSSVALLATSLPAAELKPPAKEPGKADNDGWVNLLAPGSLAKWKVLDEFDFDDHG